jgi:hypothetical protein
LLKKLKKTNCCLILQSKMCMRLHSKNFECILLFPTWIIICQLFIWRACVNLNSQSMCDLLSLLLLVGKYTKKQISVLANYYYFAHVCTYSITFCLPHSVTSTLQ